MIRNKKIYFKSTSVATLIIIPPPLIAVDSLHRFIFVRSIHLQFERFFYSVRNGTYCLMVCINRRIFFSCCRCCLVACVCMFVRMSRTVGAISTSNCIYAYLLASGSPSKYTFIQLNVSAARAHSFTSLSIYRMIVILASISRWLEWSRML